MDEIRSLEEQIARLQWEVERQRTEAAALRQQLSNENLEKLRAYEAQMKKSLDRRDKAVRQEYERLLKEYEKSADKEVRETRLQMDREYQKLRKGLEQKEKEWAEKNRRLEELTAELKKDIREKDAESAEEAKKYIQEAALKFKEIDKKPHEKFFPRRIDPFHRAINEAGSLFRNGLSEAAIAVSISARSGLSRLGSDIDEEYEEWKEKYGLFKRRTALLAMKLQEEPALWDAFTRGEAGEKPSGRGLSEKELKEARSCLDYWTEGVFGEIGRQAAAYASGISAIEKEGVISYLKRKDSMSLEELEKAIAHLDSLNEELEKAFILYKERYTASCERADWGELIIDYLTDEINLEWLEEESGFKAVGEEKKKRSDYRPYMELQYGTGFPEVDTRERLELVFLNSMGTRIFVYLLPLEREERVENRVVVYVDFAGACNGELAKQIYAHVCESMELEEAEGIVRLAEDIDQLKTDPNVLLRETGRSIEARLRKMH